MEGQQRRIGMMTLSLRRERTDLAERFGENATRALRAAGCEVTGPKRLLFETAECIGEAKNLEESHADCILLLLGTWVFAPTVVDTLRAVHLPVGVWCEDNPGSFSLTAGGIVHGSLDELGLRHRFFYGSPASDELIADVVAFADGAACSRALESERLAVIGGRVMGMYTTMADLIQVKSLFGVEIEHVDSVRVYREAEAVESNAVEKCREQLSGRFGGVHTAAPALDRSMRLYLALKSLLEAEGYDMVAVKCQEEMINGYASFCLANSLLNNEGYTVSCESDINGALSMKLLQTLSGGVALFGDVNHLDFDGNYLRIVNCGSMPTVMARSERDVLLENQYEYMGEAGGATTVLSVRSSAVTLARLYRLKGKYCLVAVEGSTEELPKERFKEAREFWPHAMVKLDCDARALVENIRSNHMHLCFGSHRRALWEFCKLKDIEFISPGLVTAAAGT